MPHPIDREALVSRHDIVRTPDSRMLPLGNGEFCFCADAAGLQNGGGNIMAHWAWHEFPLPEGVSESDLTDTGSYNTGRLTGEGRDLVPPGKEKAARWMFDNPHSFSMGRLRFAEADGTPIAVPADARSEYSLWQGLLTSRFTHGGQAVQVYACVHPDEDAVSIRVETGAELSVLLDFAYPSITSGEGLGTFDLPDRHTSDISMENGLCRIVRTVDRTTYAASWRYAGGTMTRTGAHELLLTFAGSVEFTLRFSPEVSSSPVPGFADTQAAAAGAWARFWSTGGAIDLSGSSDGRWHELERRIVLSQYILRVQGAGSWPCAEGGLMYMDPWRGQFHMEMVWWHAAHYALWQRMELADRQLGCYRSFLPMARKLASQLGYKGAKWGKSTNPNGRTAPWEGNLALLWKQPHPIFFAELEYRNRPTAETLEKWAEIINETAVHMADYPVLKEDGYYHLDPVMPPSELCFTSDTLFDLAYWRWALDAAQTWRQRMGLPRVREWDEISDNLAPLPVQNGLYLRAPSMTETYTTQTYEHPDPVGIYGMLPPTDKVNRRIAHNSLLKVWETWQKNRIWGWDFPWISMCAARVDEPEIAVESLMQLDIDEIGASGRGCYPYLPANGALLYAAAMMAVGPNGEQSPGFPKDGRWQVRAENILGW